MRIIWDKSDHVISQINQTPTTLSMRSRLALASALALLLLAEWNCQVYDNVEFQIKQRDQQS